MSSVVRWLWPFRTGNDEHFGTLAVDEYMAEVTASAQAAQVQQEQQARQGPAQHASQHGDLYRAITTRPPARSFDDELRRYTMWRRQRGLLQNMLPTSVYGGLIGLVVGVCQSRREGRYLGRCVVVGRYACTFALVGATAAAVHALLLRYNGFEDMLTFPLIAGTAAAMALPPLAGVATLRSTLAFGPVAGIVYAVCCLAAQMWRERHVTLFCLEQQRRSTPVHRVAPELQLLYRAYLYDRRPLEERAMQQRQALLLARDADDDYRLDATRVLQNMTPEVWYWVNFPPWWPLKSAVQSDSDALALQRYYDDQVERVTRTHLAAVNDLSGSRRTWLRSRRSDKDNKDDSTTTTTYRTH